MGSSLLTNSTAMTALQTLRTTGAALSNTQNRISTGQRVATASDNAAYWSIATSMRADNAALSAVSDSLGLSAATVDTEYTALTAVIGSDGNSGLTKLQALLVEAKTAGIDRTKIQADITQIQQRQITQQIEYLVAHKFVGIPQGFRRQDSVISNHDRVLKTAALNEAVLDQEFDFFEEAKSPSMR